MKPRFKDLHQASHAMKAMLGLQTEVDESGLEPGLLDLVKMRASQINGCAYCLNMLSNHPAVPFRPPLPKNLL